MPQAWPGAMALADGPAVGAVAERDRRIGPLAIAAIGAALFALRADEILADPDSYWHIATGRRIATSWSIPTADPFSHTAAGKEWILFEWLSQLIFFVADGLGGWNAVGFLCIASAAAAIYLLARHLVSYVSDVHALLICLLAVLLTMPHLLARPHVLAWPVMVLWVAALVRAVDRRAPPPLWLLPVATLWANLHASFVLGLAFMGLLALEAVLDAWTSPTRARVIRSWATFVSLAIGASLVTPQGVSTVLHILSVQGQPVQMGMILEWHSPNFHQFQPLAVWMGLFLVTALTLGLRVPLLRVAAVMVLLFLAFRHVRHVELVGLLAPIYLAQSLSKTLESRASGSFEDLPFGRLAIATLAIASLLFVLGTVFWRDWAPSPQITPTAAFHALGPEGPSGKVLNDYDFGGFLIAQGVPTFVDGRSDLFGDKFLSGYVDAVLKPQGEDALRTYLDGHDVSWTIFQPSRPVVAMLDRLPGWHRAYADDIAVVHVREKAMEAKAQ